MSLKMLLPFLFCSSFTFAQISDHQKKDYVDFLDAQSREAVHQALSLSVEDSAKFWRIYDNYSTEIHEMTMEFMDLIDVYTDQFETLDGDQEYKMIKQSMHIREEDLRIKEKYFELVATEVGAEPAVIFYQVEMYQITKARLDIMERIPFVGQ